MTLAERRILVIIYKAVSGMIKIQTVTKRMEEEEVGALSMAYTF